MYARVSTDLFSTALARLLSCLVCMLISVCCACANAWADAHNVGFRSLGFSLPEREIRFDVNVWYPCKRKARTLRYPPWEFRAASRAPVLAGTYPLLILSHPSAGNRFSFHDTARDLAAAGFIVAAITHSADNMDNMPHNFTWQQFTTRVQEIKDLIDLLLVNEDIGKSIDALRIGMLGIGAGGTTSLLLGGAMPNCYQWEQTCTEANCEQNSAYCNEWAKDMITTKVCTAFPLGQSLADQRIKAVAAISPAFAMLFSENSFRYFYPPLLIGRTERDIVCPAPLVDTLIKHYPKKATLLPLVDADTGALSAECPEVLASELPELCLSVTRKERKAIHADFVAGLIDFFTATLVRTTPLTIPEPPKRELVGPVLPDENTQSLRRRR